MCETCTSLSQCFISHLVGITNAGIPSADNVGYAIKSTYLLNLIDSAPIDIPLPKGRDLAGKDLPTIIKIYTPYIAFIKIYWATIESGRENQTDFDSFMIHCEK